MGKPADDPSSFVDRERLELADRLEQAGPEAPTLCEGWATRDLVAHLVLRERSPAAAGIIVAPLSGWTQRRQRSLAQQPYPTLVEKFRRGPVAISPLRLPGVQSAVNTFEHFVHHEDVQRASSAWQPRDLADSDQSTLWRQLSERTRLYLRGAPVPITLAAPDLGQVTLGDSDEATRLTITGAPAELVMYVHGRRDHARVQIEGSLQSQEKWNRHSLRV